MIVKELIEKLKNFPPDAQVLVQVYEDGYDDIVRSEERMVVKNPNAADYNGEYEDADPAVKGTIKSVVIMGNRR